MCPIAAIWLFCRQSKLWWFCTRLRPNLSKMANLKFHLLAHLVFLAYPHHYPQLTELLASNRRIFDLAKWAAIRWTGFFWILVNPGQWNWVCLKKYSNRLWPWVHPLHHNWVKRWKASMFQTWLKVALIKITFICLFLPWPLIWTADWQFFYRPQPEFPFKEIFYYGWFLIKMFCVYNGILIENGKIIMNFKKNSRNFQNILRKKYLLALENKARFK